MPLGGPNTIHVKKVKGAIVWETFNFTNFWDTWVTQDWKQFSLMRKGRELGSTPKEEEINVNTTVWEMNVENNVCVTCNGHQPWIPICQSHTPVAIHANDVASTWRKHWRPLFWRVVWPRMTSLAIIHFVCNWMMSFRLKIRELMTVSDVSGMSLYKH